MEKVKNMYGHPVQPFLNFNTNPAIITRLKVIAPEINPPIEIPYHKNFKNLSVV
jgi:hypothetical protein